MDVGEKYFGGATLWATILLEQFQNRSGFEIEQGETCLFPYSNIWGHLLTFVRLKKLFSTIASMIFTSKVMC